MRKSILLGLIAGFTGIGLTTLAMGGPTSAQADEITIVSWGGSFQAAQRKVYFEPFT